MTTDELEIERLKAENLLLRECLCKIGYGVDCKCKNCQAIKELIKKGITL